ncbi:MAG: hypothetical protein WA532_08145 [Candidatus Korobacteraceae bacterium]
MPELKSATARAARRSSLRWLQPGTDKPLVVKHEGKEVKYQVITREGYTAKHPVE